VRNLTLPQSTLEFELRLQEYIELARAQKKQEAMAYLQKHLASWQETHLPQIMQVSMLLAVGPSTKCGRYRVSLVARSGSIYISWYLTEIV
jgi:macrophage erythroblast attacher